MSDHQRLAHATDRPVVSPRFAPGLSTTHGGVPTGDPDVSPDQTFPGWLPQLRSAISCHLDILLPPCGARADGHTVWLFSDELSDRIGIEPLLVQFDM